jgi:hypothetical protein
MIKVVNNIVGTTSIELETLQSLLAPFSPAFIYSIIESGELEFTYKLLVEIDPSATEIPSMVDFLEFLSIKVDEVNQAV